MSIFLDIQKAFDSVNHDILIRKLDYAYIRGSALKLFKLYLSNRSKSVRLNDILSASVNVTHGVHKELF